MAMGIVVVLLIPCAAWGALVWTDPQVLVDQSDYVVRGKIVDMNKEAGQANVKVEETLKGVAKEKIPVKFQPRKEANIVIFDNINFEEGMEIWILERADKDGRYDLNYPLRRMPVEQAGRVEVVADFKAIKWSKPVDGLAGAVRTRPTGNQKPVRTFDLYLAVKNVSDKTMTIQSVGAGVQTHFMLKSAEDERINQKMSKPQHPDLSAEYGSIVLTLSDLLHDRTRLARSAPISPQDLFPSNGEITLSVAHPTCGCGPQLSRCHLF